MSDTESTEAQQAADESAAESTTEEAGEREAADTDDDSADDGEKTYDAKYVSRLNKEAEKHRLRAKELAAELDAAKASTADYADIKAELDSYKTKEQHAQWAKAAAEEYEGLDPSLLRGSSEEDYKDHAKQLASLVTPPRKADPNQGKSPQSPVSEEKQFARQFFGAART